MTDPETPTPPKALSVFTCINRRHPTRSCYALIENTTETRNAHRQWHIDQEGDLAAVRGAVRSRDETIVLLRQEIAGYRRDVAAYGQEVAGFHGEVQRVETPTIPPQLEIDRAGYSDDELEDEPDEPAPLAEDLAAADEHNRPTTVPAAREEAPDEDDEDEDEDGDYAEPATVHHSVFGGERRF